MDLILTLPLTKADCEWVLSAIKLIKIEYQALLIPSALDNLMMVYLNSPAIKIYDLQSCGWLLVKSRIISRVYKWILTQVNRSQILKALPPRILLLNNN